MNKCDLKHLKYNNFFFFFNNDIFGRKYINYQDEFEKIKNAEDGVLQMFLTEEYNKIKDTEINIDYSTQTILKEAIDYGEQIKTEILFDKKNNKEKIVNENEFLENNYLYKNFEEIGTPIASEKEEFAVLSILSKIIQEQGVETAVYKENNSDNNDSVVQLMCCDFSNKYDFVFDFGEDKNKKILEGKADYQNLCNELLKSLSEKLKIEEKDIILSIPKKGSAKISVTFASNEKYKEEDLENAIKDINEYKDLKKIHKSVLMEGCKLTPKLLDKRWNNRDPYWGNKDEKRAGFNYIPPYGWIGYGLYVQNKYDNGNNDWLSYEENVHNQYAIAYYAIRSQYEDYKEMKKLIANLSNLNLMNDDRDSFHNIFEDDIDIRSHNGEKCGNGIYLYQDIEIAEKQASIIEIKGILYKVLIMCRVNPNKIRIPESFPHVWILNPNTFEIRQYRILVKIIDLTEPEKSTFITYPQPKKLFREIISKKDLSFFQSDKLKKIMEEKQLNKHEAIVHIYSTNDYTIFNNSLIFGELVKSDKYSEKEIKSFIWCLHSTLRNYYHDVNFSKLRLVKDGTVVYRREEISFDLDKYGKGSQFYLSNFISTSSNINTKFGIDLKEKEKKKHMIYITIRNNEKYNYCYYIRDVSDYPNEEEVLITAYCNYYITNVTKNEQDESIIVYAVCLGYVLDDDKVNEWSNINKYKAKKKEEATKKDSGCILF